MAEQEATTAAPARKRASRAASMTGSTPARASAPRKAAPKKAAPAVVQSVGEDGRERYQFDLVHLGDTKSYAKFGPPNGSACVGTLYMPLGTKTVKVLMIGGPAE